MMTEAEADKVDIKGIIERSQKGLRDFVLMLAARDPKGMALFRQAAVELGAEEGDEIRTATYDRQIHLIDTVGEYIYGEAYRDAVEKAQG
jgi:hypothetical protein